MAWLSALPAPILLKESYVTEYKWAGYFLNDVFYVTGQYSRLRTITAWKYPALTQAAARSNAASFNGKTDVALAWTERANAAGAYNCFVTYDVAGRFTLIV